MSTIIENLKHQTQSFTVMPAPDHKDDSRHFKVRPMGSDFPMSVLCGWTEDADQPAGDAQRVGLQAAEGLPRMNLLFHRLSRLNIPITSWTETLRRGSLGEYKSFLISPRRS
jgi:hypothetical protein